MGKAARAFNGGWCAVKKLGLALLPVFVAAGLTVSLTLTGWVAREVHELSKDVAVIKSSRFTKANGQRQFNELSKRDLPQWLKEALERMEGRLERLDAMLVRHVEWHADGRIE